MAAIECVIFDWAGTTVDYGCFAPVRAFMEVFMEYGVEPTVDEVRKPMGMLKIDHIRTMLKMDRIAAEFEKKQGRRATEDDVVKMHDMFTGKLMSILDRYADSKPYASETADRLRELGIKIGSTTGYNNMMMDVVASEAEKNGYAPDFWVTPDSTDGRGRPYPYMIFRNMEKLGISSTGAVLKVGDTVSDILEGKNAGVKTVGVIEGSSVMALTMKEYESLSEEEKKKERERTEKVFMDAGADYVIKDIRGVLEIIEELRS